MSDSYRVVVTREDGAWLAEVEGMPGVQTWARSLSRLEAYVREAIALARDLPDGAETELQIEYDYRTGSPEFDAATAETRALRERVDRERRELARRTEELAQALVRRHHVSVRDAARMTGVSMQRISQLTGQRRRAGGRGAAAPERASA